MKHTRLLPLIAILAICTSPVAIAEDDPPWIARAKGGMVASDSPEASKVGANILKSGGNAFDAAIATSFALNVGRPYSTGLGGGGFMVAYLAKEKRFVALDFRETAPAGATPEHYAEIMRDNDGPSPSIYGGNAVGVPGLLAGLGVIHKRYATQPWSELVRPSIALCGTGVAVDADFRDACKHIIKKYDQYPTLRLRHPQLGQIFLDDEGHAPQVGTRMHRNGLSIALRFIAEREQYTFYEGQIATAIVNAVRKAGGTLTADDLAKYKVRDRDPITVKYRGYDVISMPPPSSGGICLAQTLNILEARRAMMKSEPNPPQHMHLRIEAMKHAFADRARWLGDSDFCKIPAEHLLSRAYARQVADRISLDRAGVPDNTYGTAQLPDDGGTSHYCVADRHGNIVAITETINATFGSFVVADPYGIILNNQMDDFTTVSGQANLYGLVQSDANLVTPGKRPLSSMSPTIVMKDNKPILTLGGSGGPRIISSTLNVMLNILDVNLPLTDAIASVRAHHQWQPDEVNLDRDAPEGAKMLERFGHKVSDKHKTGVIQAIRFLPDGTFVGASDPRKGGRPAGTD